MLGLSLVIWSKPVHADPYKSHEKSRHFFIIDLHDQSDQATAKKRSILFQEKGAKVLDAKVPQKLRETFETFETLKPLKLSRNFENCLRDKFSKLKFLESPLIFSTIFIIPYLQIMENSSRNVS